MTRHKKPLDGIRVLDLATFIAAPFAASIAGEFGAEVIKIEHPDKGDPLRNFGTPSGETPDTFCWLSEGRNKKSLTLNLKTPEGAAILKRLVAVSDVVCENFRPGTLEKWGIGYEDLKAINPRLVMLRISGFGQTGPLSERTGFARIAHAFGGLAYLTGMPGGPPLTPGSTSLADYVSGVYGALGIVLALRVRDRDQIGQCIDLALYEPIFRMLDDLLPAYAANGAVRGRQGLGTSNACPHGHFLTGDGRWVAIACTSDRMFERLCKAMGRPELSDPEQLGRGPVRISRHEEVDQIVQDWLSGMTADEALTICASQDVPCSLVNSIADIFGDPHFEARNNYVTLKHDALGAVPVPGVVPHLTETPGEISNLGPELGCSSDEVLSELLGLGPDEIASLRAAGAV
ncbi:CoA transferase [Hoeflea sp. WL0058]|uniref:CoA transferase n=1 Tax=Flavimaribacter sediminis TaxID=2865987 RepID=A0AAE2ZT35_9HYPH|nr:CoA transferase [Flavimaribacter sediminis]MBW8639047.1 CoA transferase [Flavimaribacter sediminis]